MNNGLTVHAVDRTHQDLHSIQRAGNKICKRVWVYRGQALRLTAKSVVEKLIHNA